MTWYPYVTRLPHRGRPAGIEVRVRESPTDWRIAEMDLGDGEIVGFPRAQFDFPGTPVRGGLFTLMDEEATRDIRSALDEHMLSPP